MEQDVKDDVTNDVTTPAKTQPVRQYYKTRKDGSRYPVRAFNRKVRKDAKPKVAHNIAPKVKLAYGGQSKSLMLDHVDGRTVIGKAVATHQAALEAHCGPETMTDPLRSLCLQAARYRTLGAVAWNYIQENGLIKDGAVTPALEALCRLGRQEAEILRLLGIRAPERPVESLQDVLAKVAAEEGE